MLTMGRIKLVKPVRACNLYPGFWHKKKPSLFIIISCWLFQKCKSRIFFVRFGSPFSGFWHPLSDTFTYLAGFIPLIISIEIVSMLTCICISIKMSSSEGHLLYKYKTFITKKFLHDFPITEYIYIILIWFAN